MAWESLVFLAELTLFTVVICGLHALKPRFGLGPLYMAVGLFEAFLFVAGKGASPEQRIGVELFLSRPGNLSYLLFLPLILASAVQVYVLEGTAEARRFLAALVGVYVIHHGIDLAVYFHATHPPPGWSTAGWSILAYFKTASRFASLGAMVCDFVVILVAYQFLANRLGRYTLAVPLFLALVLAMMSDALVYALLRGKILQLDKLLVPEKLQSAIAAGVPMAAYLRWQLRRHKEVVRKGYIQRDALDIIALRRRVAVAEAQLEELRGTFSRYVSAEVVDELLGDPSKMKLGGELRQVTILFADIRGYTSLAEALEPMEVIGILNQYFDRMTPVILDQKGMINEFEGDAVLAVFGAPNVLEDHAERAVRTAVEMLNGVDALNQEWEQDGTLERWRSFGLRKLAIRIGLHSGPVIAGNIGSVLRTKYGVIGDTVNTTSRVEHLNKALGTSLLLTSATRESMAGCGVTLPLVDMGSHEARGRAERVWVYTVDRESMRRMEQP